MDVFVAFDIETTGTDFHSDHITEIAAYKFARLGDAWVEVGRFQTLVNPGVPIPQAVQDKIPITDQMVAAAPDEKTAVAQFKAFVGDGTFVGHNCNFDLRFISQIDPTFAGRTLLDTYYLSRVLLPGKRSYSLVELVKDQGLTRFHSHPHRAWSDALATAALFAGLVRGVESLPAADLAALRKSRGHSNGMWSSFLYEAVHGDGVGAPARPAPAAPADDPAAWWEELHRSVPQPAPSAPTRAWHLGDRIKRSWVQGLGQHLSRGHTEGAGLGF